MSQAMSPRPFRLLLSLITGLALALGTPVAASAAAAPDTTVTWSVKPADTAQGRDRPNYAYDLAPGGTVGDALYVANRSAEPITLQVYAADGFLTEDGALDILAGGSASTDLGSWVSIETTELTLDSGADAEVPFTVAVPSDTPPGDYAAGIVASMSVTSDTGTVTERRLGSRMHLRVLGDLAPALTVDGVSVDYHGTANPLEAGSATVRYTLTNAGNARLDPDVDVALSGPLGWARVTAADDAPELLPGSSLERTVEVAGVAPLGLLAAEVTATSQVVTRTLAGTEPSTFDPLVSQATAATAAMPWTAMAILAVLALIVVWRIVAARRRKAAHAREIASAVAAATAQAGGTSALVAAGAVESPSAPGLDDPSTRSARRAP
ncbi:NEW3 domain-containing protein [Microbacterium sp. KSW4-17]|uniref:NEW3 domain-containing protein n=1 Tax=Microbacterium galbum TaxID=3075994 RepID=A0ABU3T7B7_9MICO|nr:NEW3 domain-containing protein [Microbacterium sp. KSW4-17]MDU0367266.1 NEW3 domain-containing protein [Microbacterium sp. KSW4-17]